MSKLRCRAAQSDRSMLTLTAAVLQHTPRIEVLYGCQQEAHVCGGFRLLWRDLARLCKTMPVARNPCIRVIAHETHVDVTIIAAYEENIEDTGPQARPLDSIGEKKQ